MAYEKYKSWPFEDYPAQTTPMMAEHMNHFNSAISALNNKISKLNCSRDVFETMTSEQKSYASTNNLLSFGINSKGEYGFYVNGGEFKTFGGAKN